MANIPSELKYSETHEWIKEENGTWIVGLTDFAQSELGDIVFAELPEVGDPVTVGASFANVESVKAVSEVYSPISGVVAEVNAALVDEPGLINASPYENWLIKVKDVTEFGALLDSKGYEAVCSKEGA